jgi:hypothetical protein
MTAIQQPTTLTVSAPGATLTFEAIEYGQLGDPDAFAAKLREVLAAD